MGHLADYLQEEFEKLCPTGWHFHKEYFLVQPEVSKLLGFSPRVDLCFQKHDSSKKLWVELEISRADPAANQMKFAASHLFVPFTSSDLFISMVSSHVARGRRNLGAQAVLTLRRLGIRAQQTPLLPNIKRSDIKRINHLPLEKIRMECLEVDLELERIFAVAEPLMEGMNGVLFLAGNQMEVRLNLLRWNQDMNCDEGRSLWGKRTITYFVFDPQNGLFAPSKFCAYIFMDRANEQPKNGLWPGGMNLSEYVEIPPNIPVFDGNKAWRHLVDRLGMKKISIDKDTKLKRRFEKWLAGFKESVIVHPKGPSFIELQL